MKSSITHVEHSPTKAQNSYFLKKKTSLVSEKPALTPTKIENHPFDLHHFVGGGQTFIERYSLQRTWW